MTDRPGRPPLEYIRIAEELAKRIASGKLAPGARLPPEKVLAAEFGVSYGTVRRAMDVLREQGLVVTRWGRGNFVRRAQQ